VFANIASSTESGDTMPLILFLCPDDYDKETQAFLPLTPNQIAHAKLLVDTGAEAGYGKAKAMLDEMNFHPPCLD
jgi:hypothetical protein